MGRPSLVVIFLLALHFLLCGVNGARVGKFSMNSATTSQGTKLENKNVIKEDEQSGVLDKYLDNEKIAVECKDNEEHCSSKGIYRKIITTTPTMPTSIVIPIHDHENLDKEGKKMGIIKKENKAKKLSSSIHHNSLMEIKVDKSKVIAFPEYENAMDMTVMDYSPAKRKPPIHN